MNEFVLVDVVGIVVVGDEGILVVDVEVVGVEVVVGFFELLFVIGFY